MNIALGTVQFGLDYGISNTHGRTLGYGAKKILQYAYDNNIDALDTAIGYGNSESIIGNSISKYNNWKITTKTPNFVDDYINNTHVKQLEESFNQSLLNLGKIDIYGLLIHSCDDLLKPGGELLFKKMTELQESGLVKKIGVSLYNKDQINAVLNKYSIDLVQLPINIFDQQLHTDGYLKKIKDNGIEIHARSVFLQGLLLMKMDLIPAYFSPISKQIKMFFESAKELSLSQLELSLGYVSAITELDKIVIGVNTVKQLSEIITASRVKIDPDKFIRLSINNPMYTNPALWKI